MLRLTKQLGKLTCCMLLPALLVSCEKEDSDITEFSGKVVDEATSEPIADSKVYVVLNSGLSPQYTLTLPDTLRVKTNSEGMYQIMHAPKEWQVFFKSVAEIPGYMQVNDIVGTSVKRNDRNKQDILMARASYLKLSINRSTDASPHKNLTVYVTYPYNVSPAQGQVYRRDSIEFDMAKAYTNAVRGYYYKRTPSVTIDWSVVANGTTAQNSKAIPLAEHDTTHFEITY